MQLLYNFDLDKPDEVLIIFFILFAETQVCEATFERVPYDT